MSFTLFVVLLIVCSLGVRMIPGIPERYRVPAGVGVALAFLLVAPFLLGDYRLLQLSRVAIWVIVTMGLNLVTGFNGQISLGHGAFVLIGAYTAAILLDKKEQLDFVDSAPWPFWATIIAGGVIGGLAGLALGIPALRLAGPYLAIATLALMISMPQMIRKYDELTGGSQGLQVAKTPPPPGLEDQLSQAEWMYFLCLGVAVVMLIISWSIVSGPLGRAFVAVRDSEVAATAMGINVARTKVLAFTISAFFAGVSGSLLTILLRVTTPESVSILDSINFLTAIVIGGLGSILGSVIGAAILIFLPSDGSDLASNLKFLPNELRTPGVIQGVLVIIVAIAVPYGLAGTLRRIAAARLSDVKDWFTHLPGRLAGTAAGIRDNIIWTWEGLPWNRERVNPPERQEGG